MTDLTPIISAVITLIIAIITTFLIPYIRSKVDVTKLATVQTWIKIAVEAAEQIYEGTGKGAEKKQYVLDFLQSKGFTVDLDSIEALIESEVYKLK